ncbi:MAG: DUF3365 domain-containing protein [Deltaproteobacteria bacterium]|nr:DUF3365 domain-containing protein [Deltaproteobacteria bacterium]
MGKTMAAGLLVLLAAGSAFASEDIAVWKGRKAADALTRNLQGRMLEAMAESGPMGAISICAYQAQATKIHLERKEGVTAKRTSLRLRNMENAPDDYEMGMLNRFKTTTMTAGFQEERIELLVKGGAKIYRYTRPIFIDMSCLPCHGAREQMQEDIRAYLDERYPGDQATGYMEGDIRGIVSVTIPE